MANNLDFFTMNSISTRVHTSASIGTTVKFKLEGMGSTEWDVQTTVSSEWEVLSTPAGLATNIPFTLTNSILTVKVWSPKAGTSIRLKVEDSDDPTHICETQTNTTVSGRAMNYNWLLLLITLLAQSHWALVWLLGGLILRLSSFLILGQMVLQQEQ